MFVARSKSVRRKPTAQAEDDRMMYSRLAPKVRDSSEPVDSDADAETREAAARATEATAADEVNFIVRSGRVEGKR